MVAIKKIQVPLTGFFGAGVGASVTTLGAEYTSRATGQVGWNACAVKGAVKGVLGLLLYGVSMRIPGMWSFWVEMMAYGGWGSWFFDIFMALHPGGIAGFAEKLAIETRVMAAGGRRVGSKLGELEKGAGAEEKATAIF